VFLDKYLPEAPRVPAMTQPGAAGAHGSR
jgi:hypothetical protein